MPNPEAGLKALEALIKAATETAGKAVPVVERYLPARMAKTLPELLQSSRMEAELAGSKAGELRGITSEMPLTQRFTRKLGKQKASHFEPSERPEIKSAVNLGAGEATGGFEFFNPRQLPLSRAIKSKAGREVSRTVPRLGLIPKSEELQKMLSQIGKIINEHQVRFGETPSDRIISRRLNTKYGVKIDPEAVQRLRAGIVPEGGPFAEAGQLPTGEIRLDAPDLTGKGTVGEHVPESVKETGSFRGYPEGGRKAEVGEAIEGLTDKQKKALMDYYVEGKTQSEIAKEMGISQKNVNVLIQKGVSHIKTKLVPGKRPPIEGGSGEFPGTSISAIFRRPQQTAEGNLLPPLSNLYEDFPYRGQPSYANKLMSRTGFSPKLNRLHINELAGRQGFPPMEIQGAGIDPKFHISQMARRAEMEHPYTQLQKLQDILTRVFMAQSRQ